MHKMRWMTGLTKLALLVTFMFAAMPALAGTNAVVTDSKIKFYQSNSTSSPYKTLSKGAKMTVYETNGDWAKVTYSGHKGYVLKSGIDSTSQTQARSYESTSNDPVAYWAKQNTYLYKNSDGSGGSSKVSQGTKVSVYDENGSWAKVKANGKNGFMKKSALSSSQVSSAKASQPATASGSATEMDWYDSSISSIFSRGSKAVVTDVKTGIAFTVVRKGGTSHVDAYPAAQADTTRMKKIYGGTWSWSRRAIWVSIGGKKYAASMNGMPHGDSTGANNGFKGVFCIHFTNSKTHGTDKVDSAHQSMIKRAAAA